MKILIIIAFAAFATAAVAQTCTTTCVPPLQGSIGSTVCTTVCR
jgi:hypothetical protein